MVSNNDIKKALDQLIKDPNFFVVDIQNKKRKIQVFLDGYKGIRLDDCIRINKNLRELFAEELDEYDLEVTSPGLNAPFKVYQQYEKNVGSKVEVMLKDGRRFEGKLLEVDISGILLEEKKRIKTEKKKKKIIRTEHRITFEDIEFTKSIISFKT